DQFEPGEEAQQFFMTAEVVHNRFFVDIHNTAFGIGPLGDLVHVADGWDPGADIQELAYSGVDHEANGSPQEDPDEAGAVPSPGTTCWIRSAISRSTAKL